MLCSAKSGWAQWTRLSNLPAIYIDTYNNTRVVSKTNYVWAAMHYVDEQDNIAFVTDSNLNTPGVVVPWPHDMYLSPEPDSVRFVATISP